MDTSGQITDPIAATGEGLNGVPVNGNVPLAATGEGLNGVPVNGNVPLAATGETLTGDRMVVVGMNVSGANVSGANVRAVGVPIRETPVVEAVVPVVVVADVVAGVMAVVVLVVVVVTGGMKVKDLLSAAPDADSESLAPPGTWTAVRDTAIDPPGELIPFLTDVESPLEPAALAAECVAEVDDWPLMMEAFAAAEAWRPCWALTWATRSLRSTLALTPLCS
jgi:hypothetical protein